MTYLEKHSVLTRPVAGLLRLGGKWNVKGGKRHKGSRAYIDH